MAPTPRVRCEHCGKHHDALPTDKGYALPDDVWAIPKRKRAARAQFTADLCIYGDRHFIRCVLRLPMRDAAGAFGWGIWAEIDAETYARYCELYGADGTDEPPKRGTIANMMPGYEDAAGETVWLQFGTREHRPLLRTSLLSPTSLARDQATGLTSARYHEVLVANAAI